MWTLTTSTLIATATIVTGFLIHNETTSHYPKAPPQQLVAIKYNTPQIPPVTLNPELLPVCSCEATGQPHRDPTLYHYEPDTTTPLIGRVNDQDRGMCQINMTAHGETTASLGLDILNNYGDYIAYSNHLYDTQGLRPWVYSKHCWEDSV